MVLVANVFVTGRFGSRFYALFMRRIYCLPAYLSVGLTILMIGVLNDRLFSRVFKMIDCFEDNNSRSSIRPFYDRIGDSIDLPKNDLQNFEIQELFGIFLILLFFIIQKIVIP